MKRVNLSWKQWAIIIIVIGALLRFGLAIAYTPSGDGCWHGSVARYIGETGDIPAHEHLGRAGFARAPLFHLVGGFLYSVFSFIGIDNPELGIHFVNPLLGTLTLILTFLLTRRLQNDRVAFFATVFMAFIPLHLFYTYNMYLDGPITLFVLATVYAMITRKYVVASISAGLCLLTNISGVVVLPMILAILWYNHRDAYEIGKRALWIGIGAVVLSIPWYVRNIIEFGNPVWPWLRFALGGVDKPHDILPINHFDINSVFDVSGIVVASYLGFFGVPDGNVGALTFFSIPYFWAVMLLWFIGTALFLVPLFFDRKQQFVLKPFLKWWVGLYLLYMVTTSSILGGVTYIRYAAPMLPAIAILWGIGMVRLWEKSARTRFAKPVLILLVVGICGGFTAGEIIKTTLASNAWSVYDEDFDWIKQNTPEGALFMTNGQCFSYHFHRQTLSPPTENAGEILDAKPVDYVWVNQAFRVHKGRYSDAELEIFKNRFPVVYENQETKTQIYKVS